MPIYEYQCTNCGYQLEAIQRIADAPLTECPSCHNHGLTKLVSATRFELKGTGWYVTDFKDKPKVAPSADAAVTSTSVEST